MSQVPYKNQKKLYRDATYSTYFLLHVFYFSTWHGWSWVLGTRRDSGKTGKYAFVTGKYILKNFSFCSVFLGLKEGK